MFLDYKSNAPIASHNKISKQSDNWILICNLKSNDHLKVKLKCPITGKYEIYYQRDKLSVKMRFHVETINWLPK